MSAASFEVNREPTLLLDSGSLAEVDAAVAEGLVDSLTTNPTLTARGLESAATHDTPALLSHARALIELAPGLVFVQPFASDPDEAHRQARQLAGNDPQRVVIKLLARRCLLPVARSLRDEGIRTAMTAVFSPAQALVAREVGCDWVIPYVDRAARHGSGSDTTVKALADALESLAGSPRILAASIKSQSQAIEAIEHGSRAISAPLDVLRGMAEHPHSLAAQEQFDSDLERFRSRREAP
jgi:transaldolase